MAKQENYYLQVSKDYRGSGLKSIEQLIISQIDEFDRNGLECYATNEQFSEWFGESVSTIKRTLDKLEELDIIERNTTFIKGKGRSNRMRTLALKDKKQWKVQIEPSNAMEGSNVDDGRFRIQQWKVHSEPIKDNLKEKKKDNLLEDANASKGASHPTPDGEKTKKELIKEKQDSRNNHPDVLKATELFFGIETNALQSLLKSYKNRSIEYKDMSSRYGIPRNAANKDGMKLLETELHWRHREQFAASN